MAPATPPAGPELNQRQGALDSLVEARDAAVRLHQEIGASDPQRSQLSGKAVNVSRGDRLHIGIEHRRAGSLIFAPFAGDLVAGTDGDAGEQAAEGGCAGPLMHRVAVGVEKDDGDGLHPPGPAVFRDGRDLGLGQRTYHASIRSDSLGDLEPEGAGHEGVRRAGSEIVEVRPVAAPDLQHISEPARGDQRSAHALALENGVDDGGTAMHEEAGVTRLDAGGGHLVNDVDDPLGMIMRRGEALGGEERARCLVETHEIGEGAANVGRDPYHSPAP